MAARGKPKNKEKKVEVKLKISLRSVLLVLFLGFFGISILVSFFSTMPGVETVDIPVVIHDIREEKVEKILVENERLIVEYKDGQQKISTKEEGEIFSEILERSDIDPSTVPYEVADQSLAKSLGSIFETLLLIGVPIAILLFIFRSQSRGAQDIFSFGRSKAKLFAKGKQDITFKDVAGVDDAKKELEEIVDFLKHPGKYKKIGARTPKGVLLFGPAGVGKTLLAKAVAGETGVPFFSMAGSEFMEMLVGVGASRARDLFVQAKTQAPSIIFIDEIDAIGRQRGKGMVGGHDEREQTLNQILVEMDGFTPNDNVIVIAATNRGDLLDPALLRPGRFDRRVVLDMPDKDGRKGILKIHAKGKKFAKSVRWDRVADRTVGFSGADLENMLNEAAILAARMGRKEVKMNDIEESATKVKLGPAKKRLQSAADRKITAYHEAGHAIVTNALPKMDPVHRISIVARGMSLGHTLIPPAADRTHETKTRMIQQIAAMMGGRVAEEIVFSEMTSGASNDIEQATRLARAMVVDFGMSNLGPIAMGSQNAMGPFGNPTFWEDTKISDSTREKIDLEVEKLVDEGYKTATNILKRNKKKLDAVSKALLKKETLDRDEFEKLVASSK